MLNTIVVTYDTLLNININSMSMVVKFVFITVISL